MRIMCVSVFAVAAFLCATPASLHWSQGDGLSLSATLDTAEAAELNIPNRHHRSASRHGYHTARYSRLYDPYCGGPYVGGGFNGGTYWGGPWMDLRCYGNVY